MRYAAAVALCALYLFLPRVAWEPGKGFVGATPAVVSGDEPHYLLAVNSLLRDRDLRLEDDYRRVLAGSDAAGAQFVGNELDHHTLVVDTRTGAHRLWQELYDWKTHVPCAQPCVPFRKVLPGLDPGPGVVEVPAHPVGFPAAVAALLAPLRARDVERGALAVVSLFAAWAVIAAFAAARAGGCTEREAWAAALLAALASPLLAYERSFFSEVSAAFFLAAALWALVSRRLSLCAVLVFLAASTKPPYGLIGVAWAAMLWRDGRRREAALLGAAVCALGALLVLFNWRLGHTPVISGTQGFVFARGPESLALLLLGNAHGVVTFAPWAVAGLWVAARAAVQPRPGDAPVLRAMAWGAAPYLVLLFLGDQEAGGFCYGPRYFVPLLPWLAIAAACAWRNAGRSGRALLALSFAAGAAIAVPGALRYRDFFDQPVVSEFRGHKP